MDRFKYSRQSTRRSRRKSPVRMTGVTPYDEEEDWNIFSRRLTHKQQQQPSSEDDTASLEGTTIQHRYNLEKFLGHGSFGNVYRGTDLKLKQAIAAKTESSDAAVPQLHYEYRIYNALKGGIGIPRAYWLGVYGENTILIMELLGENLQRLRTNHTFSLCTVLTIADEMLRRLEHVHNCGFVYRDVKPDNFVMGLGSLSRRVYLLDYGLAKRYLDTSGVHIPFVKGKHLIGTARYSSIHSHMGYELSRRDDLEALGYVLLYLLRGELPWQGLQGNDKREKYERIGRKKIQTPLEELCADLPLEFINYFRYCRYLQFEEQPDYEYLRGLFRAVMLRKMYRYDAPFEWE